ncbi:MAG: hypothetical protein U5L06_01420 [Rhodovibrio sp.]|nr:hypothetical protein [Rhodovibrio sp.]
MSPRQDVRRGASRRGTPRVSDGYRVVGKRTQTAPKNLLCMKCGQRSSIKSNLGIKEELTRISAYLAPPREPSCPNARCENHRVPVSASGRYYRHGRTSAGTERHRCRSCGKVFSEGRRRRPQAISHENREIFLALVNKQPIRAIARTRGISTQTVYEKIDFIHRQCLSFLAAREAELARKRLRGLYISVDRQDYIVNWSDRAFKRNTQLTAIGSADNFTGYVFGMHLNYDPDADRERIEAEGIVAGDYDGRDAAYTRHARYWTEPFYRLALAADPGPDVPHSSVWTHQGVAREINDRYDEIENIPDREALERVHSTATWMPPKGVQVRFEYTAHAHFRLLRRLLSGARKVRFYMDQDDTLRAACLSAFAYDIMQRRGDAFYVQIDKTLMVDDRRRKVRESRQYFDHVREVLGRPDATDWQIRVILMAQTLDDIPRFRHWRDNWVGFPEATMPEPDKAICYLTDRSDYGLIRKAILFSRASLHGIDRYFMQLRRRVMPLERPIATPSNVGRVWHGYCPYNPKIIQQLLDIYRAYYNYVEPGADKKTPAMRLGIARGKVRVEDILYHSKRSEIVFTCGFTHRRILACPDVAHRCCCRFPVVPYRSKICAVAVLSA